MTKSSDGEGRFWRGVRIASDWWLALSGFQSYLVLNIQEGAWLAQTFQPVILLPHEKIHSDEARNLRGRCLLYAKWKRVLWNAAVSGKEEGALAPQGHENAPEVHSVIGNLRIIMCLKQFKKKNKKIHKCIPSLSECWFPQRCSSSIGHQMLTPQYYRLY